MEENCYAEPIYKTAVSAQQLQHADRATLTIWGMGCQNYMTRVRNSFLRVLPKQLVDAVAQAVNDGRHEYRAQFLATE